MIEAIVNWYVSCTEAIAEMKWLDLRRNTSCFITYRILHTTCHSLAVWHGRMWHATATVDITVLQLIWEEITLTFMGRTLSVMWTWKDFCTWLFVDCLTLQMKALLSFETLVTVSPHGASSRKTCIDINTAVRTSNHTCLMSFSSF